MANTEQPNFEVKPLTEATAEDFKSVVARRFSPGSIRLIDYILTNPLRSECASCGDIVYEDGRPVCIQAAILRKMYYGQKPFLGVVGGFLARLPDASPETLLQVISRTISSRGGSSLFFANTAVKTTVKLFGLLKVKKNGGPTWMRMRVRTFRPLTRWYMMQCELHPRLPKLKFASEPISAEDVAVSQSGRLSVCRRMSFDEQGFGDFWTRYLKENQGVVSSRDPVTLKWIFEQQLNNGRALMFCAFEGECLVGYCIVNRSASTTRVWRLIDMLAIGDNPSVLDCLLGGAIKYLKAKTSAVSISVKGFPKKVDSLLKHHFPFEVKSAHNPFLYAAQGDKLLDDAVERSLSDGWFGCPYDGDAVL